MRGLLTAALFLAALIPTTSAKAACDLDSAPSTHWSVVRHGAISSLVTPCGDSFYSTGVNVLDGGITAGYLDRPHYDWRNSFASLGDWIAQTKQRLADWGFNSAGAWSLPPKQLKLPSIINLELGRLARFHWFDPFDPAAEQRMFDQAKALTAPYRDSPYRIGYFADNEVGWWDGALFLFYGQQAATSFTKQRWLQMLRDQYRSNWQSFTADFVPPAGIASWDALLNAEKPTKLRIGGNGMPVVERWTGIVAGQYYKVARAAAQSRRSRRAVLRRPAADLLRPGGDPRRSALRRRDRAQLQCRQSRRLAGALFLRRVAQAHRRQARADFGMVLCGA